MSFENRSLVILGATGGIGAAIGRQLAPLGCRLTLAARDQSLSLAKTPSGSKMLGSCNRSELDKDVVRRVLAARYRPQGDYGPSCLTLLGHTKASL